MTKRHRTGTLKKTAGPQAKERRPAAGRKCIPGLSEKRKNHVIVRQPRPRKGPEKK